MGRSPICPDLLPAFPGAPPGWVVQEASGRQPWARWAGERGGGGGPGPGGTGLVGGMGLQWAPVCRPEGGAWPGLFVENLGSSRTLYSSKWAQDKQRPVSLLQLIDCKLCRAHLPLNHLQTRRVWAVEGHRPRAWGESVVVPTRGPSRLPAPHPLGPLPGRALGDMKGRPLCAEPVGGPCPRHKASCERLHRGLSDCHVSM